MFRRYVINKVNNRTKCYQGILVTLGTMKHKGQLSDSETKEAESLFLAISNDLPIPPEIETEAFKGSTCWLKKDATQFNALEEQMKRAARVLNPWDMKF